jgi:hypothetical protein
MAANRARDIFVELLAHVPPERWDERLAELAGSDAEVRGRVAALLEAHRGAAGFLDQPARPLGGTGAGAPLSEAPPEAESREQPGQVLGGRYKLIEPIGEGGMGSVWMAQQTEPVRRRVALNLIRRGRSP